MYADSDSPQVSEEGCDFSCLLHDHIPNLFSLISP
jgi:hypothetical protein